MAFRRDFLNDFRLFILIILVMLALLNPLARSEQELKNITIGGAFSLSGNGTTWGDCLMATLLALDHINNNSNLLPGYHLNMEWGDTRVTQKSINFRIRQLKI